ncbi:hypothetical protein Tco_0654314 [Tanacetum coccineum]|uniref:Uncharacterized protein n=1 Tax=Tanacetum coccineum TaxID=301880 RepID=A0ABQ4X3R8_9ASTR
MEVNVCDVIDFGSDPFMCSELTKTIHDNTSLNSQDVETSPIQNDPDTVVPEDVEPSHTQHIPTIPTAGMKFDTEDKLYDYFTACAYKVGFGLRRSSVRNELKVVEVTMLLDVIKEGYIRALSLNLRGRD